MAGRAERETPAERRWPDFFIVGQAKSGTTALHEMLDQHAEIFMPGIKEPGYFANELYPPEHRGRAVTGPRYHRLYSEASEDQILGDASTQHIFSREAARNISEVRPDAKIIVFFRDPAAFIVSVHRQLVQNRYESEGDLRRALALEPERAQGRSVPRAAPRPAELLYTWRARYVEQLRRYEEHFPAEQILTIIYDDYRADNRATLSRIFGFLGVRADVSIMPSRANPTVEVRSPLVHRALYLAAATRGTPVAMAARRVTRRVPERVRRRGVVLVRDLVRSEVREPDPAILSELRVTLRPQVQALSEHLDRDLVGLWGY